MRFRTLGNSGTAVSVHCLGTMTFGAEADEKSSGDIMDAFVAAGGNFVDIADVYAAGVSEEIVGRWMATHPTEARELVIATKGRFPVPGKNATETGLNNVGASRRHLTRALDASLRRLQVEHLDLYQIHAWDALTPIEETLSFLDAAVRSGKIGSYGFSNFLGWQLTKAVHVAKAHGWVPPVTLQPQYNLLVRGIEHEIVPAAEDASMGLLPWSPLAGGWLTGKYERGNAPSGPTRLGEDPERGMEAWGPRSEDDFTWNVVDAVRSVATEAGSTPAAVALAWLDAQPAVTSTILGARNVDQLEKNLAAVDLELSLEQLARLTEASTPQAEVYPYGPQAVDQRFRSLTPQG